MRVTNFFGYCTTRESLKYDFDLLSQYKHVRTIHQWMLVKLLVLIHSWDVSNVSVLMALRAPPYPRLGMDFIPGYSEIHIKSKGIL